MSRPVATRIALPKDALTYYTSAARLPFPSIIDYADPAGRPWTIIASDPVRVLIAKGNRITDWRAGKKHESTGNPFDMLQAALKEHAVAQNDTNLPFAGGAVGYLGYDLAASLETLPRRAVDDRGLPDMVLAFHDRALVVDRTSNRAEIVELNDRPSKRALTVDQYAEAYGARPPVEPWGSDRPVISNFKHDDYLAAVAKIRDYIRTGDCYQVNLSQRFYTHSTLTPFDLYQRLRGTSPAPYSALIEIGSRAVISSSPELFLDAEGRRVVTRPIKGTRPRGVDEADDQRQRLELMTNPKEDAELAMIVDLERNDLGRVSEFGSVKVAAPKTLESHPTVHHLVATIEGKLRRDVGPVDLLRASFPSGSVTGAPKIRAMEIIDELEPTRRAAYTGAIGWIGFDGRVGLSVAIRIIERHGDRLWFQVGGGIVADSDPEREFNETLVKAAGIVRALGLDLPA